MSMPDIAIICFISFFVSTIGVSVGGSGLIVVPLLIALGMNSQNAIATNMFALIFMPFCTGYFYRGRGVLPF
jgi:uncharacterized membrane protein YfcA